MEKIIKEMVEKGIINGYADGTFKPNKELTRAEATAMNSREINYIIEQVNEIVDKKIEALLERLQNN